MINLSLAKIKKRDGRVVNFNQEKITTAIFKALEATRGDGEENRRVAERISDRVVGGLETRFGTEGEGFYPTVEQTQDLVETTLMKAGYEDVAKAYILYRQKHAELREARGFEVELENYVRTIVQGFVRDEDWQTRENASAGAVTFQGLNAFLSGEMLKNFALNQMYAMINPKIKRLHEEGKMHIHDLAFPVIAYCAGWSLEELIRRGFGEVPNRTQSSPPKHLETLILQMVNFIGTMQGEFAGAQAFSSVDTRLAPFVKADNLGYKDVKQKMQMLIYGLNVPSRWGWQAPFSNLTFDLAIPEDLKDQKVIIGWNEDNIKEKFEIEKEALREYYIGLSEDLRKERGIKKKIGRRYKEIVGERDHLLGIVNSTYGEYQKEIDMINRGFLEVMREGDKNGRIFTFPIPTYNLTKNFDWDSDIINLLFEVTGKYGTPYFQNYIGSGLDPASIRAMCCRLNLDQTELMNRPGNIWGAGDSTGSIGVVTMNMNRIGYEAGNEEEFFNQLGETMDVAKESLEIKRKVVEDLLEGNFVPYTKSYLGSFEHHFSTIGLCGMHESCLNFLGEGIGSERGKEFTIRVLNFMREKVRGYQLETGNLYNLEATPAESTSYRFAKLDKEMYPHNKVSGDGVPFLTNSTQLNVDATRDLFEAIEHQNDIQPLYTGGTIFHTFLPEEIGGESAKRLVRKIAENTRLPYFSLTPTFSVCENHGYLRGKQENCPECGSVTEIYSRIVGYYRPITNWNDGKQEEFRHRTPYEGVESGN